MKKLLALSAVCALALGAAEFPFGGESFPMEEISAKRFATAKTSAENLLKNADLTQDITKKPEDGWAPGMWIFKDANRKNFGKATASMPVRDIVDSPDGRVMRLNNGIEIEELMKDETINFTTSFEQVVTLPPGKNRYYKLSFQHLSKKIGTKEHRQAVLISSYDGSNPRPGHGKSTTGLKVVGFPQTPSWSPFSYEFGVPDNTRDINVNIRADGCGELSLKDFALVPVEADTMPLSVRVASMELLDDCYVLANGQPGLFAFSIKSNVPKDEFKFKETDMVMELPATVSVVGTNYLMNGRIGSADFTRDGVAWKRWTLGVEGSTILSARNGNGEWLGWGVPEVMLVANDVPGKSYDASFLLKQGDKEVTHPNRFTLKIMAPIPVTPQSNQFYTGISVVSHDFNLREKSARELLAKFIVDTGNSMLNCGLGEDFTTLCRNAGVKFVTSETGQFCNGHLMGNWGVTKPEYAKFRTQDGKHFMNFTCPASLYKQTPYFTETLIPILKKTLNNMDGLVPNWEPYRTRGTGCYCDVCKGDFATFAKLSKDEVDKIWPKELLPGGSYRKQAIEFRAWQHASVVKLLNQKTKEFGGKKIGFCPEVGTDQAILYPRHYEEQWEFSIFEYASDLEWLNVWGPYIWFIGTQPYTYSKGAYARTFEYAKRVNRDFHKTLPKAKTKLMAMPHGNQCGLEALGQPEGMAMDQLSSFLGGYDASISYFFPRGYDHRFWAALAYATRIIADNEAIVMKHQLHKGVSAAPVTPFPAPIKNISPETLPDVTSTDLLQTIAYQDGKTILAAVGNFWTKGDVVFKLQIKDLAPKSRYSVFENEFKRQFVAKDGKPFTGAELAKGVLLHAGALRWAFFRIQPQTNSDFEVVKADVMDKLVQKRSKANAQAAKDEAERDRKLNAENDCGELKELKSGKLSCKPVTIDGRQMLAFQSGKNTLLINTKMLAIHSWKLNGVEQLEDGSTKSAFWFPGENGCEMSKVFHVDKQEATAKGMVVSGSCVSGPKFYPQLPSVKVIRTLAIDEDLSKISVTARLENPTAVSMEDVGYRWWLLPLAWNNTINGHALFGKKPFKRPRNMTVLNHKANAFADKTVRKLFQVNGESIPAQCASLSFVRPDQKQNLRLSFQPEELLGGVAIWDTAGMEAATVEPFYNAVQIAPGDAVEFTMTLEFN